MELVRPWQVEVAEGGLIIWGAIARLDIRGMAREVIFRAIKRDTGPGYQVDRLTIGPWEGIDDGVDVRVLEDAQRLVEKWCAAAEEQGSLVPKLAA